MPVEKRTKGGGLLKVLQKGETANPNGRPRKFVSALKHIGYKKSEIDDCIQSMLGMKIDELKEVFTNPDATILEKTLANAMRKSLEKGSLDSIETLITRIYGKPKETIDQHVQTIVIKQGGSKSRN